MDRINSQGVVLVNGLRMRAPRNTATGVPGTELDANYDNGLQEEMMAILAAFGMAPSAANLEQVLTCLQMLPRVGSLLLVTSIPVAQASFVIPVNVTFLSGILTSPSGGSSGATSSGGSGLGGIAGCAGAGSGAGATAWFAGPVTPGETFDYGLGSPGQAGPNGQDGTDGGSSFASLGGDTLLVPPGRGAAGFAAAGNQAGGDGGGRFKQGFSGALPNGFAVAEIAGGDGGDGISGCNLMGGDGGASFWGGGGRASTTGGAVGSAPGSGSGGGYTTAGTSGAQGADGILVLFG